MDDFDTLNFNESLSALVEEAKKLNEALDELSNKVRLTEDAMRKSVNLPFTMTATEDLSLVWRRCDKSGKFRIFAQHIDHGLIPVIETTIEVRAECSKYLAQFAREFAKHISWYTSRINE